MRQPLLWWLVCLWFRVGSGQRCQVPNALREEFYNTRTQTWTLNSALLDALDGDLQLVVNCAVSEIVNLVEDLAFYAANPVVVSGPVRFEGTLSPDGSRPLWSCTENNDQILSVQNATDVSLHAINFFNCSASMVSPRSSLVVNNSRVEITDCLFEENGITGENDVTLEGGALSVHGSSVISIERSEFRHNEGHLGGAACFADESDCRLSQVNFTENLAYSAGGAILLTGDAHVDAEDVDFSGNEVFWLSGRHGGAISLNVRSDDEPIVVDTTRAGVIFKMTNSICQGSSAWMGGCVYAEGNARLDITDSLIFNNSVRFQPGTSGTYFTDSWGPDESRVPDETLTGNGGGIYAKRLHSVVLARVNLTNNRAPGKGGCLYMEAQEHNQNLTLCSSQLVLDECTFQSNEAPYGGGLHVQDYTAAFLNQTRFIRNAASTSGGAISIQAEHYDDEICQNGTASLRYGVRSVTEMLDVSGRPIDPIPYHWYFTDLTPIAALMMQDVQFDSNEANSSGGAVFGEQGVFAFARDSLFARNRAEEAGAVYFKQAMLYANSSSFRNNTAPVSSGAITINGETDEDIQGSSRCEGYMRNSLFAGNVAGEYGGAVLVLGTGAHFLATQNLTFERNQARAVGAIMSSNAARLAVVDSSFMENSATAGGGAIAFGVTQFSENNIWVSGSTFAENEALRGAAISGERFRYVADPITVRSRHESGIPVSISISGATCINNSAGEGGILYARDVSMDFEGEVRDNRATGVGGAFSLEAGSVVDLSGTFTRNDAMEGGAIHVARFAYVRCRNCHICNNSAVIAGGGTAIDASLNGNMTLAFQCIDCTIQNNTATFGASRTRSLSSSATLTGNVASIGGGAVMTTHPHNVLVNCTSAEDQYHPAYMWGNMWPGSLFMPEEQEGVPRLSEGTCPSWTGNRVEPGGFGPVRASYALSYVVCLPEDCSKSHSRLPSHRSTGLVPPFFVRLVDAFDQSPAEPWPDHTDLRVAITSGSGVTLSGQLSSEFHRGEASLNQTTVVGHPGEYSIDLEFSDGRFEGSVLTTVLDECRIGEQSVSNNTACQNCSANEYRIGEPVEDCQPCNENAICDFWGIAPRKGYWLPSPCFTHPKKCLSQDSCDDKGRSDKLMNYFLEHGPSCDLSDDDLAEFQRRQCNTRSEGLLCGSCGAKHGRADFSCYKCVPFGLILLFLVGGITWTLVVTAVSVTGSLSSKDPRAAQQSTFSASASSSRPYNLHQDVELNEIRDVQGSSRLVQNADKSSGVPQGDELNVAKENFLGSLKVFMNFAQVNSTALVIGRDWKFGVTNLLSALSFVGALSMNRILALDCLFEDSSSTPRSISSVTLSILLPFASLFIFIAFWLYRIRTDCQKLRRRIMLTTIVIVYMSYIEWVKQLSLVLKCEYVSVGITNEYTHRRLLWAADTSVECYKGSHAVLFGVLALPLIVIILFAFPIGSAVYLIFKRQNQELDSVETKETFGFMYGAYTENCVFWDTCILLRKGAIALVAIAASTRGNNLQGLIAVCILVFFLFLHMRFLPYKAEYEGLNSNEAFSLLVSLLTFALGLFLKDQSLSSGDKAGVSFVTFVLVTSFVIYALIDLWFKLVRFLRISLEHDEVAVPPRTLSVRILVMWVKHQLTKLRTNGAPAFNK